jgi:hypothetical protein
LGGTEVNLALVRDGGRSTLAPMPIRPPALAAAALAALALCLALPVAAGAQSAPSLGAPGEDESAPVVTQTTSSADDGGLETWQQVLIFGAGVVLLGGIAWAIIGDARHRAPVAPRGRAASAAAGDGGRLPPHERRRRKERARARGRAQRRARRRNR